MATSFWGAVYGRALLGMCSAVLSAIGAGSGSGSGSGPGGTIGGGGDTAPLGAATGTRAFALGLCAGSGATALLWKIQKAGSVGVTSHPALLPCVGAAVAMLLFGIWVAVKPSSFTTFGSGRHRRGDGDGSGRYE